ncbi:MAG: DoxX family protein [Gemmatimonadota bacterium]|nr:DoxX family protein [Gemmatimonadota bacterium]
MASHKQLPAAERWAHTLFRIFAGAVIAQHGAQKLFGAFGGMDGAGQAAHNLTLIGIAGPIEFLGGLLIILGLFTRPTAFILSGEMAVAYFLMHSPKNFWPIQNHGEVPVLLCFAFLYLAATGAGVYSLDYVRTRNRPSPIM